MQLGSFISRRSACCQAAPSGFAKDPLRRRLRRSPLPSSPFGADFGETLPRASLVPPSWFRTTSTVSSSSASWACCIPLPTLRFTGFPRRVRRPGRRRFPSDAVALQSFPHPQSRCRCHQRPAAILPFSSCVRVSPGLVRSSWLCSLRASVASNPVAGVRCPMLSWASRSGTSRPGWWLPARPFRALPPGSFVASCAPRHCRLSPLRLTRSRMTSARSVLRRAMLRPAPTRAPSSSAWTCPPPRRPAHTSLCFAARKLAPWSPRGPRGAPLSLRARCSRSRLARRLRRIASGASRWCVLAPDAGRPVRQVVATAALESSGFPSGSRAQLLACVPQPGPSSWLAPRFALRRSLSRTLQASRRRFAPARAACS
jgi:hypothetical protein